MQKIWSGRGSFFVEFDTDPVAKQEKKDKRKEQMTKLAVSKRLVLSHNSLYTSNADRLEVDQRKKSGQYILAAKCVRTAWLYPLGCKHFSLAQTSLRTPLAFTLGTASFKQPLQEVGPRCSTLWRRSFLVKSWRSWAHWILVQVWWIHLSPFPSISLRTGCIFGIDSQIGLVSSSRHNIKEVTAKGLNNIAQGHLSPSNIEKNGKLQHVVPPSCVSIHGKIEEIQDLAPFDMIHVFDAVNNPEYFAHLVMLWNKAESEICKFLSPINLP